MISGILLIIGAITVHYVTPNVISQLDVITSPLQGNMVCGFSKDIPTYQSKEALSPSMVDVFFHQNICSTLEILDKILVLSSLGAGFVGISLAIFGVLIKPRAKNNSLNRNTRVST